MRVYAAVLLLLSLTLQVDYYDSLVTSRIKKEVDSVVHCSEKKQFPSQISAYDINLDDSPSERWQQVTKEYADGLRKLVHHFQNWGYSIFYKIAYKAAVLLIPSIPQTYMSEMYGIAKAVNVSVIDIVILNSFYEFFALCTSTLSIDKYGNLLHGRNLDFGAPLGWDAVNHTWTVTELLKPITVKFNYISNGDRIASSVNFVGLIGCYTCVSTSGISLSMNQRFALNGGFMGIIETILGSHGGEWVGFLMREVILNGTTYHDAVKIFTTTRLMAPVYVIVGGNKQEGVNIERARNSCVNTRKTNWRQGEWFTVQTNSDHNYSRILPDDRKHTAEVCMTRLKQNITYLNLFNVLSTHPVHNEMTIFTAIMSPADGTLEAYLQNSPPRRNQH